MDNQPQGGGTAAQDVGATTAPTSTQHAQNPIARVAVRGIPYHIDQIYDYIIPAPLRSTIQPGMRAEVPFGKANRRTEALVLVLVDRTDVPPSAQKSLLSLLDDAPVLSAEHLKLCLWMRERFYCTVCEAARAMLPSALWIAFDAPTAPPRTRFKGTTDTFVKLAVSGTEASDALRTMRASKQKNALRFLAEEGGVRLDDLLELAPCDRTAIRALQTKNLIECAEIPHKLAEVSSAVPDLSPIALAPDQQAAFDRCMTAIEAHEPQCGLLQGVTGSGKTSVYLRLLEEILAADGGAIVLVPEIALTPQMLRTFEQRFGTKVALLHSALGMRERYEAFLRVRDGVCPIVVGTRSAVFAPVQNLRLIIIDEEQEPSYQSENTPRYHAVETAKYRCAAASATLLLGSATPTVATRYSADQGRLFLCTLPTRYNQNPLPDVRIVSLADELRQGNGGAFSQILHTELTENLSRGEQSILLLNRRGTNKLFLCPDCGYKPECPRCSVNLPYHGAIGKMLCHYCGVTARPLRDCPQCGGAMRPVGIGTQKAEAELAALFPGAEILRMDADSTGKKGSHQTILDTFRRKNVPFLIGTQMVAKGHDFPNVTLVGILAADNMLWLDEYRAHERAFSLITQAIGRAGRAAKPGRAVIQTYLPTHPVLLAAARQDYDAFYESEIALREARGFPPFVSFWRLTVVGTDASACLGAGAMVRDWLTGAGATAQGPVPDPIARVNLRYRYHVTLQAADNKQTRALIARVLVSFPKLPQHKGLSVFVTRL